MHTRALAFAFAFAFAGCARTDVEFVILAVGCDDDVDDDEDGDDDGAFVVLERLCADGRCTTCDADAVGVERDGYVCTFSDDCPGGARWE